VRKLLVLAIAVVVVVSLQAQWHAARRPVGYVRMEVVGVAETDLGPTLFLTDKSREVLVPVGLGSAEGVQGFESLGKLREARVDLDGSRWNVKLVLQDGSGRHEVEAPASALALAERHPEARVWLARDALDEAGLWKNPRKKASLGRGLREDQRHQATELGI
jgi:hypothetical protein